ncbi:hypothetical protein PRIPAC_91977, partial [Pristionchus pacificus]|uniref:Uncharacterized protein n=1 Tax=Pristionchus pacificus TaxID=54126 RepID=A0A8R1Y6D4_PRIPA
MLTGAQVRSDLKNSSSIKMRAQKATSKMFLLLKALPFNCPSILISSYKAYVLPLLDFASPFWNPHYSSDIATLEKVQHTFTRQLFYRCFPSPDYPLSLPSYSDRIKTLGLRALTERRVIGGLCMTHMIMNGFTIIPRSLFYVYKPLRDRTSSFGINIELTTSTPRYHSFPVRTSRWYSQLPDSIRTASNIRMFKLTQKAATRANIIFRGLTTNNVKVMVNAYTTYVRPMVEFCPSVAFPVHKKEAGKLEKLQNKVTRLISYKCFGYNFENRPRPEERNEMLNLKSLTYRRKINDFKHAYELLFGNSRLSRNQAHFLTLSKSNLRGAGYKVCKDPFKTKMREKSFANRISNVLYDVLRKGKIPTKYSEFMNVMSKE